MKQKCTLEGVGTVASQTELCLLEVKQFVLWVSFIKVKITYEHGKGRGH
jgi:hypothetical protein